MDLDVKSLLQQDEVMKVYSFRDILICLCEVVAIDHCGEGVAWIEGHNI